MKTMLFFCPGFFVVVASGDRAQDAGASATRFTSATVEQTGKSLVQAMASNSLGLQVTAAVSAVSGFF